MLEVLLLLEDIVCVCVCIKFGCCWKILCILSVFYWIAVEHLRNFIFKEFSRIYLDFDAACATSA